jgi:hypothetical protein
MLLDFSVNVIATSCGTVVTLIGLSIADILPNRTPVVAPAQPQVTVSVSHGPVTLSMTDHNHTATPTQCNSSLVVGRTHAACLQHASLRGVTLLVHVVQQQAAAAAAVGPANLFLTEGLRCCCRFNSLTS